MSWLWIPAFKLVKFFLFLIKFSCSVFWVLVFCSCFQVHFFITSSSPHICRCSGACCFFLPALEFLLLPTGNSGKVFFFFLSRLSAIICSYIRLICCLWGMQAVEGSSDRIKHWKAQLFPKQGFTCVLNRMKIKAFVSMSWNILTLISWSTPRLSSCKKSDWAWCWLLFCHAIQKLIPWYKGRGKKDLKCCGSSVEVLGKLYSSFI